MLSRVCGRNFLLRPDLHRSLFGDGIATMFAAFFGGPPNTTYGENIGVLAITRVLSVWVVGGAEIKIGEFAEASSMALSAIIGMILHAALPGKESAGRTEDILADETAQKA